MSMPRVDEAPALLSVSCRFLEYPDSNNVLLKAIDAGRVMTKALKIGPALAVILLVQPLYDLQG